MRLCSYRLVRSQFLQHLHFSWPYTASQSVPRLHIRCLLLSNLLHPLLLSCPALPPALHVTSATPLREGGILRRRSQLEVGSPPNNLPASPAASLPSNSSAVAPQQPASPSSAPSAQGKAKNKATSNKSKTADSSQQGKPRFQWSRASNVIDGLHPEGQLANCMGIYENWKVLYSNSREEAQFCEEHVIPYFTAADISCKGLSPSAIVGRVSSISWWWKMLLYYL